MNSIDIKVETIGEIIMFIVKTSGSMRESGIGTKASILSLLVCFALFYLSGEISIERSK